MTPVRPHRAAREFAVALAAAIGTAAAWPAPASAQVAYTITDLGNRNGLGARASGINANGQVAGYFNLPGNSISHAFRTTPGGTLNDPGVDLGTLGGSSSSARGINAAGQVAGSSYIAPGSFVGHAFRTSATGLVSDPGTDLGIFPGGSESGGSAINAAGQVTGFANVAGNRTHAFRTTSTGTLSDPNADIGTLGGMICVGSAINSSGQVAGSSWLPGDVALHAFRTTPTGRVSDPGTDLGTLGGSRSSATGINDAGQVVGDSYLAGDAAFHAFRTTPTGRVDDAGTDLGTLPTYNSSTAYGINSLGVVVGQCYDGSTPHAFIYDTMMRDLNGLIPAGSGWILSNAGGINDSGQIAGYGFINGETHVYLLTPVPEPSSVALAGATVLAGWIARRRRRSEP